MNKDYEELPKYGKIFDGTVSEQVKIAKKFKQNMRLKENLKKDWRKLWRMAFSPVGTKWQVQLSTLSAVLFVFYWPGNKLLLLLCCG